MPPQQTIEELLRPWIAACPVGDHADCQYAEVVIIIHQGRVRGYDIRLKRRFTHDPPEGGDSDRNSREPSG